MKLLTSVLLATIILGALAGRDYECQKVDEFLAVLVETSNGRCPPGYIEIPLDLPNEEIIHRHPVHHRPHGHRRHDGHHSRPRHHVVDHHHRAAHKDDDRRSIRHHGRHHETHGHGRRHPALGHGHGRRAHGHGHGHGSRHHVDGHGHGHGHGRRHHAHRHGHGHGHGQGRRDHGRYPGHGHGHRQQRGLGLHPTHHIPQARGLIRSHDLPVPRQIHRGRDESGHGHRNVDRPRRENVHHHEAPRRPQQSHPSHHQPSPSPSRIVVQPQPAVVQPKPQPPPAPREPLRLTLSDNSDLTGRQAQFHLLGTNDLRPWNMYKKAISMRVEGGPWVVCTALDYGADCWTFQPGFYRDLNTYDLAYAIASVKPGDSAPPISQMQTTYSTTAWLYEGPSFDTVRQVFRGASNVYWTQLNGRTPVNSIIVQGPGQFQIRWSITGGEKVIGAGSYTKAQLDRLAPPGSGPIMMIKKY